RAYQRHHLLLAVRGAIYRESHAHAPCFFHTGYSRGHFPRAALQDRSELKRLHSAGGNPDVRVTRIDQSRGRPQESHQQATLKNHQKRGKTHTQHRHRKTEPVVNDVLPRELHNAESNFRVLPGYFDCSACHAKSPVSRAVIPSAESG